jgi:hypothetical protein
MKTWTANQILNEFQTDKPNDEFLQKSDVLKIIDEMKNRPIRFELDGSGLTGHEKDGEFIEYKEFVDILEELKSKLSQEDSVGRNGVSSTKSKLELKP